MNEPVDVVCAGIIVADHVCAPIPRLPHAGELMMAEEMILTIGGCAANTAVDLAKMGVHPAVVGRIGEDAFGRIVREMLADSGVDTRAVCPTADRITSQTMILNVQGEDRRFIHIFGANACFSVADIPTALAQNCRVFYLGGYLVMPGLESESLATLLATLRQAGVKTVVDVAVAGPGDHLARLKPVLPHVDVFLPNQDEASLILNETDPVNQAEQFRDLGAATVVITLGGDGAVLVGDGERLRAAAYPIEFVDGSGGGDAFDAGFIYGILRGMDASDCLRYASALGASCVRAIGTTRGVFTEAECRDFIAQHELTIERL